MSLARVLLLLALLLEGSATIRTGEQWQGQLRHNRRSFATSSDSPRAFADTSSTETSFRDASLGTELSASTAWAEASLKSALFEGATAWSALQVYEQQSFYSFLLSMCNVGAAETSYNTGFLARLLTATRPTTNADTRIRDGPGLPDTTFPQGVTRSNVYDALNALMDIGHCQQKETEDLTYASAAVTDPAPLKSVILHAFVRDSVVSEATSSNSNDGGHDGRVPPESATSERLSAAGDIILRELRRAIDADKQGTEEGIKQKVAAFKAKWKALIALSTEWLELENGETVSADSKASQASQKVKDTFGGLQGSSEGETVAGAAFRDVIAAFLDISTHPSLFAVKAAFGHASGGLCTASQPADPTKQTPEEQARGIALSFGCSDQTAGSLSRLYGVMLWKQVFAITAKEAEDEFVATIFTPLDAEEKRLRAIKNEEQRKKQAEEAKQKALAEQKKKEEEARQQALNEQKPKIEALKTTLLLANNDKANPMLAQPQDKAAQQQQQQALPANSNNQEDPSFVLEGLEEDDDDIDSLERENKKQGDLKPFMGAVDQKDVIPEKEASLPVHPHDIAFDKLARAKELQILRRLHIAQSFYIIQAALQSHDDPCTIASLELPPMLFARMSEHNPRRGKRINTQPALSSKWIDPDLDFGLDEELKSLLSNTMQQVKLTSEIELAQHKVDALDLSKEHKENGSPNGQLAKQIVDSKKLTTVQATMLQGQVATVAPKGLSSSTNVFVLFKRLGWLEIVREGEQEEERKEAEDQEDELDLLRKRYLHDEEDGPRGSGVSKVTLSKAYLTLVNTIRQTLRSSLFVQAPPPFSADPSSPASKSALWLPLKADYQRGGHPGLQSLVEPAHVEFTALRSAAENFAPLVTAVKPLPSEQLVSKETIANTGGGGGGGPSKLEYPEEIRTTANSLRNLASFILMLEVAWQYGPGLPDYEAVIRPPLDFVGASQIVYSQGLHRTTFSMSLANLEKYSEDKKALGIFKLDNIAKWESRTLDVAASYLSYRENSAATPSRSNSSPSPSPDPLKAKRVISFSSIGGVAVPVPKGRIAIKKLTKFDKPGASLGGYEEPEPQEKVQNKKLLDDFGEAVAETGDAALDAAQEKMQQGFLCATVLENGNIDKEGHRGVASKVRRSAHNLHSYYRLEQDQGTLSGYLRLEGMSRHNAAVFSVLPDPSPYSRFFIFCTAEPMPNPATTIKAPTGGTRLKIAHDHPEVQQWAKEHAKPLVTSMCVASHSLGIIEQLKLEEWFSWAVWSTSTIAEVKRKNKNKQPDEPDDPRYFPLRQLRGTAMLPDMAAAFMVTARDGSLLNKEGRLDCNALMSEAESSTNNKDRIVSNGDKSFPLDLAVSSLGRLNAGGGSTGNYMGRISSMLDSLARVVIRDTWSGHVRWLLQNAYWKPKKAVDKHLNTQDDFNDEVLDKMALDTTAIAFNDVATHGESPRREAALLRKRKAGRSSVFSTKGRRPPTEVRVVFGRHAAATRGKPLALTLSPTARMMIHLAKQAHNQEYDSRHSLMECDWPKEAMSSAKDSPLLGTSSPGGEAAWLDYWYKNNGEVNILRHPLPPTAIPTGCRERLSLLKVEDPQDPDWQPRYTHVWKSEKDRLIVFSFSYQRSRVETGPGQRVMGYKTMSDLLNDSYGSQSGRWRYDDHDKTTQLVMRQYGGQNYQYVAVGYCMGGAAAISYARKWNWPAYAINPAPIVEEGIRYRYATAAAVGGLAFVFNFFTLGIPRMAVNQVQRLAPNNRYVAYSRMLFPRRWKPGAWLDEEARELLATYPPPKGNGMTTIYSIASDWASSHYLIQVKPDQAPEMRVMPTTTTTTISSGGGMVKAADKVLPSYSTPTVSVTSGSNPIFPSSFEPGSFTAHGYTFVLFPCLSRRNEAACHSEVSFLLFPLSSDPMLELIPKVSIEGKDIGLAKEQMSAWEKWQGAVYPVHGPTTSLKGAALNKQVALTKNGPPPRFRWPTAITFPDTAPTSSHSMNIGYPEVFSILQVYDRIIQGMPPVTNMLYPENRGKVFDIRKLLEKEADVARERSAIEKEQREGSSSSSSMTR